MGKLIRVFPRKTNATPDDENARFSEPGLWDEADEVHISVTWTWDKPRGEELAEAWHGITSNIKIGGPAYDDSGGEFTPGLYLRTGYIFTSRGCPNNCWFCMTPKREGKIRELKINNGWNIFDSNLLACSDSHIQSVFDMLKKQTERPRFTGGLEAARLKPWIAEQLKILNPDSAFFAYDEPNDFEPLLNACKTLRETEALTDSNRNYGCYVLIGYPGDNIANSEKRLNDVLKLGLMPMAMLYNKGNKLKNKTEWIHFQRTWANKIIVGSRMSAMRKSNHV